MHPVARFLLPVLAHHDRSRFEVFVYSSRYLKDGMTTEIAKRVEHWREVHQLDDAALAELILADGIGLLIDLTMYARDCRPALFARKPAPVQITYLAYVGTTGLATMDYRHHRWGARSSRCWGAALHRIAPAPAALLVELFGAAAGGDHSRSGATPVLTP